MHHSTIPCATLLALLTGGTAACAHANDSTPQAPSEEIARVQQDNAALRSRMRKLETRVKMLERGEAYSVSTVEVEGAPRPLPVVRLGAPPGEAAPEPRTQRGPEGTHRLREAVTLQRVPSDAPGADDDSYDPSWGGDPAPGGLEAGYGSGPVAAGGTPPEWYAEAEDPAARLEVGPAESEDAVKSYRLVGSHLVDATRRNKPRADNPPRTKKGSAIIAEYERARAVYKRGEFAAAERAFADFVSRYPRHDYADNALYWQGEAAYDQAHYSDALALFTAVVERYGGGNKAPDALLKIGLCYGKVGDAANARDVLEQLIAAYPRANATKIARNRLPQFEGGGHGENPRGTSP